MTRTCDLRRENTAKLTLVGECAAGIDGRMSLGPSKVPCLSLSSSFFFFLFLFWLLEATHPNTAGHSPSHRPFELPFMQQELQAAQCSPGPFELAFMQQEGGIRAAQMQFPGMRLPAGQSLQNTFRGGPGAHGEGCDNANKGMGRYGGKAKADKAWHGKRRPGKMQYQRRSAHEAGQPRSGLVRLWW